MDHHEEDLEANETYYDSDEEYGVDQIYNRIRLTDPYED